MIAASGFSQLQGAPNSFSAEASPRSPLGELAGEGSQDPLAGLRGTMLLRRRGGEGKGKEKGGKGKEEERGRPP